MLSMTDVYEEGVLTVRQCQNWFAKFRSGNFNVEDAPRCGRPVEAEKDAIKALVDANNHTRDRCVERKKSGLDESERCSTCSPANSPKIRLRKFRRKSNSYEVFCEKMGSNRTGEVNCKIYSEGRETLTKSGKTISPERNGTETVSHKSRQSSQTPEYVKRTAKLFESVNMTTEETEMKNGTSERHSSENSYTSGGNEEFAGKAEKETRKISLDCLDGESNKKPSYVGVSCSNSGYRNVINYDSKLREGFWTANSQRESLVLSSSRLRESSPMRRDFDIKSHNGRDSVKIMDIRIEREPSVNGVSQPEKFVNISTSTKTISTFRNSKDMKGVDGEGEREAEEEKGLNGVIGRGSGSKVNLRQILNGKGGEETHRRGYSSLGFSPRILKSPEKNCNSFLKSISSFENNCRKSETVRSTTYSKTDQRICDSSNSILQRIERLYGPGALAQGFYTQKSQFGAKSEEPSLVGQLDVPPSIKLQTSSSQETATNSTSKILPKTPQPEVETKTETRSNLEEKSEAETGREEGERDGHRFLKLLKKVTDRLEELASFAESELENGENLPEEVSGKLRAAAGKARLLVCQKLHQFEGLCHKNLNEKPGEQFPTTREDLAGFWDMVMLQVVQVYGVFDELEEMKKNNWMAVPAKKSTSSPVTNGQSQPPKTTPKRSTPTNSGTEKRSEKSESAKKAREEGRRKMLEDRRRKMKELKENKMENEVEIFAK